VINYIEKGIWLHDFIHQLGYRIKTRDGVWVTSNDVAVQAIIDAFEPLPYAQDEAKAKVKEASAIKRLQYVTQAAGKDAEYKTKEAESAQYELDGTIGVFMQARMDKTGEGSIAVGLEWSAKAANWKAIGAEIAAIEDKASIDIDACPNWTLCESIAKSAIDSFNLI
jgi:hypothetical protein